MACGTGPKAAVGAHYAPVPAISLVPEKTADNGCRII